MIGVLVGMRCDMRRQPSQTLYLLALPPLRAARKLEAKLAPMSMLQTMYSAPGFETRVTTRLSPPVRAWRLKNARAYPLVRPLARIVSFPSVTCWGSLKATSRIPVR